MDAVPPPLDPPPLDPPWLDPLWLEAAAAVQAEEDAELRLDAREVYLAEAARCRLADRSGEARLHLSCGAVLLGSLTPAESIAGHLALLAPDGSTVLVPDEAVVMVEGSRPSLRPETSAAGDGSITRWLRESWEDGAAVRVLDAGGTWHDGPVVFVGHDHAAIATAHGEVVLPYRSVQAWAR